MTQKQLSNKLRDWLNAELWRKGSFVHNLSISDIGDMVDSFGGEIAWRRIQIQNREYRGPE